MIEVRKAIVTYLKTLHPRVYFQVAPEKALFPYIVYDLPNSFSDGEGGEIITLDIDGWDSNTTNDSTVIENMMKNINNIDKKVLMNDEISMVFYLENKMALVDDDKSIKRKKYTYQGKLFE